jgi:hypothetical protein
LHLTLVAAWDFLLLVVFHLLPLRIASAVFAVRLVGGPIGCQFVFSSLFFFFFSFFRLRLDALVAFSAFLLCSGSHAS